MYERLLTKIGTQFRLHNVDAFSVIHKKGRPLAEKTSLLHLTRKILMQSINSPEMFVFLKENHCSILKIIVLANNVHLHINGQ